MKSSPFQFVKESEYGTTLSRGRTIVIVRVQIKSEDGRLLADGTVDMFCVK